MKNRTLGQKMYVAGFAVAGTHSADSMAHALTQIVDLVGMDTAGMPPQIWVYPLPDGRGGKGETICQPLVESFIISDAWPDLAHKGKPMPKTYIILASCLSYDPRVVAAYLTRAVGPVLGQGYFEL